MFQVYQFCVLAALFPFLFACSSSLFTGDRKNDLKANTATTSEAAASGPSEECRGLDLSSEALSVSNFRKLVACLDANHSIEAYHLLTRRATDRQLRAVLDVVNAELVMNKPRLKGLDRSVQQLDGMGRLDAVFRQLGALASHPRFGAAVMRMLHRAAEKDGRLDPDLTALVQVAAREASAGRGARENLRHWLETTAAAASSPAFDGLMAGLALPIAVGRPALRLISDQTLRYLQDKTASERPMASLLARGLADGSLYAVLDRFSAAHRSADAGADLAELLRYLTDDPARLSDTVRLFGKLDAPIRCLDRTKMIPNGDMFVLGDLARMDPSMAPEWVLRSNALRLKIAGSTCELPDRFNEVARVLADLAQADEHRDIMTVARLAAAAHEGDPKGERYTRLLIQWLGDRGAVNVATNLTALLAEAARADRRVFENGLALLNNQDRGEVSRVAGALVASRPELGGRSALDAMGSLLRNVDPDSFFEAVSAAADLIGSRERLLAPTLGVLRDTLVFNDSNPLLDALMSVGSDAASRGEFFQAILELSEAPEFEPALRLTARLARDGGLKQIVEGLLALLRGTTKTVAAEPRLILTAQSPSTATDNYGLAARAVTQAAADQAMLGAPGSSRVSAALKKPVAAPAAPRWPRSSRGVNACRNLDLEMSLADTRNPAWRRELLGIAACVNADGGYDELESLARYLSDPSRPVAGRDAARFLVDSAMEIIEGAGAARHRLMRELGDILTDPGIFRDFSAMKEVIGFWLSRAYSVAGDKLAPAQALLRVLPGIDPVRRQAQKVLDLAAELVEDPRLPRALRIAWQAGSRASRLAPGRRVPRHPLPDASLLAAIKEGIHAYDEEQAGQSFDEEQVESRALAVAREYWSQVLSQRRELGYASAAELKGQLKPMLDAMGDSGSRFLEHALTFFRKLDGAPYDAEWLESWFHRLSGNIRVIPYHYPGSYPGDAQPSVRAVNQLDLLELIVRDGDFTLAELGQPASWLFGEADDENFAIKYLTKLAQAGDGLQAWVDELKAKVEKYDQMIFPTFDPGIAGSAKRVFTGVVTEVIPVEKELKRRIFNLKQVYVVVSELVASEQRVKDPASGRTLVRNDLGLLRDLFAAVLEATPANLRGVYHKDTSSLSFITAMVNAGVLRNIGTAIWERDPSAPTGKSPVPLAHLFRLLTDTILGPAPAGGGPRALNPDALAILDHLLREDSRSPGSRDFNDRYVFLGRLIDQVFTWPIGDLKAFLYEMSRLLDEVARSGRLRGADIPGAMARALRPWLDTAKGTAFLGANLDLLKSRLTDPAGGLALALINGDARKKDLVEVAGSAIWLAADGGGAVSAAALDVFESLFAAGAGGAAGGGGALSMRALRETLRQLGADPEYRAFQRRVTEPVCDRFSAWLANPKGSRVLPPRLMRLLATKLRNGDALALLHYAGEQSRSGKDELYHHLSFLGRKRYLQAMEEGFQFLKEGLVESN